jgi:hypothetical protein
MMESANLTSKYFLCGSVIKSTEIQKYNLECNGSF